jgi:hypothetical protein
MGIGIFKTDGDTAMYDSTTGIAFGPVADGDKLRAFQVWLDTTHGEPDARQLTPSDLHDLWGQFCDDGAWVDAETGELTEAAEVALDEAP